MERLLNEFVVRRPVDEAWKVLTDVERIAPCLPGAQLEEIDGTTYKGVVKVKLGPISTAFRGQAEFVERDDAGHRAVLKGSGRDTTGKGNADALITASLESLTADTTKCTVTTELHITGKVAQFGRGILGDVSEKLIAQFADNLNAILDQQGSSEGAPAPASASAEVAPLELSNIAGAAVAKRLVPLVIAVAAVIVIAIAVL
ncbi:MAG: SRPBCC family protein [Ilumatobacteraceae bacterium]